MSIYSKLFLRNTTSPYGDVTRNSVLSFKDLDQNFIFLKERDISGVNYSSNTLTIETLGGNSFTTTISGGTGGSSDSYWISGSTGNYSIKQITDTNNDSLSNYSASMGDSTISSGVTSISSGYYTYSKGESSFVGGYNEDISSPNTLPTGYNYGNTYTGETINGNTYYVISSGKGSFTYGGSDAEGPLVAGGDYSQAFGKNNVNFGDNSAIFGRGNYISNNPNTNRYNLVSGQGNGILDGDSNIVGGDSNGITASTDNTLIIGRDNISLGGNNGLIGGRNNRFGGESHIVGGFTNIVTGQYNVVGGSNNNIQGSYHAVFGGSNVTGEDAFATLIAGDSNTINGEDAGVALGFNNTVNGNTSFVFGDGHTLNGSNSAIIGGTNLTGVSDNTVYVPNLNINNVSTGTTLNLLAVDANGDVIEGEVNVSPTTLIVNNSGDNTTAEKGSLVKTYDTLVYAANQAVSGDTIYVMAGDYSITDSDWSTYGGQSGTTLYRDGVTWYFEPGSVVTNEVDKSNNPCIFYVNGSNQSCEVYGRARFVNQYQNVDAYASLINGNDDGGIGSDLIFECQDFDSSIFYYPIWCTIYKNVDIKIHGTIKWKSSWGMTLSPADTVEAKNLSLYVNHVDMTEQDGFYPLGVLFWAYGNGGALTGHNVTFEFNTIETISESTASPQIWINTDDSYINVKGKKFINTRTDGTSTVSSLVGVRGAHNSNVNIHIDDCIATSLRTNKSLIMLHNNDSEETSENNYVKITGRYEALQGSVLSTTEGGLVRNSNTYVLDGEFISNTQYVAYFEDNDTDVEISGELRCNYTGSTGYGIRSIVSNSNILLRDLEIVTQGADAINSTVATEIDIKGTLTTNTDVNSNVTLRGVHNLNNISKPDDLTVRGREILSQTVGSISTTGSTLDWSLSNNFDYTLTTGTTFTFTGDTDGQTIVMGLTQDGTGGHTVTWPAGVKWAAGGTEPTMTSASGSTDVYTLIKINGTVYGSYIQDFQ